MEWISVKDKLPARNKKVLVFKENEICISSLKIIFVKERQWENNVEGYTHWMPLPKPPEE